MSHSHFVPHRPIRQEIRLHRVCDRLHGTGNPTAPLAHGWEGPQAETAFEEAWKVHSCAWVKKVESKVGTHVDRFDHTDFEIVLCNGMRIKVDVKASINARQEFLRTHHGIERKVVVIVADRNASDEDIRKRTLVGIAAFLKLTNKAALAAMPPRRRNV